MKKPSHFLDALPFTLSLPGAQELRDLLAKLYWRPAAAYDVVDRGGIDASVVNWDQPIYLVWYEVLRAAANQGRLRAFVEILLRDPTLRAHHDRLRELAGPTPVVEARGTSDFAWKEGLDENREKQIEERPTLLPIAFLERALQIAPAIARLTVTCTTGRYHGTGFLIGEGLLLTNHHVLHDWNDDDSRATAVDVRFDYEVDFDGKERAFDRYEGDPSTIRGDRAHDWAIVRLAEPLRKAYPVLSIAGPSEAVRVDDPVCIIQHPFGEPKHIGIHHNDVRYVDDDVVHYRTDTYRGSSGAPVFDERWQVVALHRSWVQAGRIVGQALYRNQGTRIERVAEGLEGLGVSLP